VVQSHTVAALTSLVVSGVHACATATPEQAHPADTAFVLMGDSARGWTRPDASEYDFKREARICLDGSADTRPSSPPRAREDAAYATFHECMEALGWVAPPDDLAKRLIRPYETRPEEYGFPEP